MLLSSSVMGLWKTADLTFPSLLPASEQEDYGELWPGEFISAQFT